MAEINIEIDGFWCQKCQDMHPILYWHERYDSYLSNRREQWERTKARFPLWTGDVEYHDNLYQEGLKECEPSECCVCGAQTSFCLIDTYQPV